MVMGCKGQKQGAIGFGAAPFSQHILITAHLHIPSHQIKSQPAQRVEPVKSQQAKGQQLEKGIVPANMMLFMLEHIPQFRTLQPIGHIDPGTECSQNKGRCYLFTAPHIALQPCGGKKAPPQTDIAENGDGKKHRRPHDPQGRSRRLPGEPGRRADSLQGGLRNRRPLIHGRNRPGRGKWRIGDILQAADTGSHGRFRRPQGLQGEYTEHRGQAHRAQKTESHGQPQQIGVLFRGPPQQHPENQYNRNDYAGGGAHVEHFHKDLFHTNPPCADR